LPAPKSIEKIARETDVSEGLEVVVFMLILNEIHKKNEIVENSISVSGKKGNWVECCILLLRNSIVDEIIIDNKKDQ